MSSLRLFASRVLTKPQLVSGTSIRPAEVAFSRRISQTATTSAHPVLRPRVSSGEHVEPEVRNFRARPSASRLSGSREHTNSQDSGRGKPSRYAQNDRDKASEERSGKPGRTSKGTEPGWKPIKAVLADNKPLKRKYGDLEIFHQPDNPLSCKILNLLETATQEPFPPRSERASQPKPIKRRRRGDPTHMLPPPPPPPLTYNLKVTTKIPRPLQFRQLMTMRAAQAPSYTKAFIKPTSVSYDVNPTNEDQLVALATEDTSIINWPIVVNWATGWCSVGNYKEVYSFLRRIADSRPLPKLEGTPIWDTDALAKERATGPTYLNSALSDSELEELEDITS